MNGALTGWLVAFMCLICGCSADAGGAGYGVAAVTTDPAPFGGTGASLKDPAAQPSVAPRDDGPDIQWATLPGDLFGPSGPLPTDPSQGAGADCIVLSMLTELAAQSPQVVRGMVEDDGDDSFTVHFFRPTPASTSSVVNVSVDRDFPWRNDQLVYSNRRTSVAIWPELIEKALAKLFGGYAALDLAPANAKVYALTGREPSDIAPADVSPNALFQALDDAVARGDYAVAATSAGPRLGPIGGVAGLVGNHKYAILSGRRSGSGELFLQLRNPWGRFVPPGQPDTDAGRFWLSVTEFQEAFVWAGIFEHRENDSDVAAPTGAGAGG
jgi:hypothetical protein